MENVNIIRRRYKNTAQLFQDIEGKANNQIMHGCHSSNSGDSSFTKTKSFEEAKNLLMNGYNEPLQKIIDGVNANRKKIVHYVRPARKIENMPVGYLPNVPNSILGLPNSMINITKNGIKTRTLRVAYASSAAAVVSANQLAKAGVSLVSALNIIELNGIQTELNVDFFCGKSGKDITSALLRIKDFGQRFNVSRICFPIVHPSMFRRIGFKFIETVDGLKDKSWRYGYGIRPQIDEIEKLHLYEDGIKPITFNQIKNNNYDIKWIANYLTDKTEE